MVADTYFFYNHHKDLSSAISSISAYLKKKAGLKANVAGLFFKKGINEVFSDYSPQHFKFRLEEVNPATFKLNITKRYTFKKKDMEFKTKSLLLNIENNFFIIVSIEELSLFKSVILPFLSYYTDVSRVYLDSHRIRGLLNTLGERTGGKIISRRVVAYERVQRLRQKSFKKSAIIYTREDYKQSFEEAIDKDQFIDKIDFTLIKGTDELEEVIFNGHISRDGVFRVDTNFKLFYDLIIQEYKGISNKTFSLFTNRERLKEEKFEVKPLEIEYKSDIFEEHANNHRFIDMLKLMKYSSLSCYHCNPYINLTILDYLDGSSLELWVVDTRRIILMPQTKCSPNFLSRLINHIFENFREGEIRDFDGDNNA